MGHRYLHILENSLYTHAHQLYKEMYSMLIVEWCHTSISSEVEK